MSRTIKTDLRSSLPSASSLLLSLALLLAGAPTARAQMVTGQRMTDFAKVFGLDRNPPGEKFRVEAVKSAIPGNILWPGDRVTLSEIPEVQARMKAGQRIKFSFRVNANAGVGRVPARGWDLSRGRSVAKRRASFHVDWVEHGRTRSSSAGGGEP